jgi:hypothetical protein
LQNRIMMREALVRAIGEWLRKHGFDAEAPNIRDYLKQWRKAQEADAFALQAPDRWKHFLHLVEFPMLYHELMSARQLAYSYLRALVALLLGYQRLHLFDDMYAGVKRGPVTDEQAIGGNIPPR